MEFTTFDLIIIGLILFLSLKGLVNGFTKELFNFIGLIGGVAVASRMNTTVGEFINSTIYPITNEPALKLTGFVAALLIVWILFSFISSILDKVSSSEAGFFSRVLGYIMTAVRYVAIFALIIVGIQKSEFLTEKLEQYYVGSQLFPTLSDIGTQLLNIEEQIEKTKTEKSDAIDLQTFKMDNNDTNQTAE
ncbi:MAG: CvpA family protein [Epsilonproteobacteria bacterium]|nr:CvpA family protein [Campylobacterota bacterium]